MVNVIREIYCYKDWEKEIVVFFKMIILFIEIVKLGEKDVWGMGEDYEFLL